MSSQQEHWKSLMREVAQLEQELLAIAPACELSRAEASRYLGRLLRYAIGQYLDRSSSPARPRLSYETARVGGDNPDYRYCIADLDGRLRYRLSGRINDAYRLGIGTYSGGLGTAQGLRSTGYINVDSEITDAEGHFELILSSESTADTWLPMTLETNSLIIRQVVLDPRQHRPAALNIECLFSSEANQTAPTSTDDLLAGMTQVRQFLIGTVRQFIGWSSTFARHPNELRPLDSELLGAAQGDPNTHYYNGYYCLRPGEALFIEFAPPPCDYWNLQACNHWLESLDIMRQPAHLNHYTAKADTAGRVCAVITPEPMDADNWIDTVGHQQGCLAMRWVGLAEGHRPPSLHCYVTHIDRIEQ